MPTGYGKTFSDDKAMNAYKKMKAESRARALARKKDMSSDDKERASIRSHFDKEAKHFNFK